MKSMESDKIILMKDMKISQPENGSFSDGSINQQHSERNAKDEPKIEKDLETEQFGFFSMSPLQKFFFIFSLLLSVLYIVVFAWLIPCQNVPASKSNASNIQVVEQWKMQFEGLSMTSNLEVIKQIDSNRYLEIFGYSTIINQTIKFGIIALYVSEGKVLWQRPTLEAPKYCKCDYLDVNLDNISDCLIVGEKGYIAVFNAIDGKELWNFHHDDEFPAFEVTSIPIITSDYNNDGILDLVVAYSFFNSTENVKNSNHSEVLIGILSSQNGIIIGSHITIQVCSTPIDKIQLWKRNNQVTDILFYCGNNEGIGNLWSISTKKLGILASKKSLDSSDFIKVFTIEQPKKKSYEVHYLEIPKEKLNEHDMLVAWDDGNILLLNGETGKKTWISEVDNHSSIKAVLSGQFSNMKNIIVLISSNYISGTKITSYHLNNGSLIASLSYTNYFITSALLLPEIFSGADGILLKHINITSKFFEEKLNVQNAKYKEKSQNNFSQKEYRFQEEYFIIQCIYNQNLEPVIKTQVIRLCYQNTNCLDDIYNSFSTAFVGNNNAENYHELILATTTAEVHNDSIPNLQESTVIKFLYLNSVSFDDNSTKTTC